MTARSGIIVPLVCALLLLAAPGAQAATTTFVSPVTPAAPGPSNDLRRVQVDNGEDTLTAVFTVRDLRRAGRTRLELVYTPRGATVPYVVRVERSRQGKVSRTLLESDGAHGTTGTLPCTGMTSRWNARADTIRVAVPQSCFPQNARSASVKAMAGFFGADPSAGDYTTFKQVARG